MREKGKVKWFSDQKGWGFIQPDNGGAELFAHHSNIGRANKRERVTLVEGEPVTFRVEQTQKGPKAVEIERAS